MSEFLPLLVEASCPYLAKGTFAAGAARKTRCNDYITHGALAWDFKA